MYLYIKKLVKNLINCAGDKLEVKNVSVKSEP